LQQPAHWLQAPERLLLQDQGQAGVPERAALRLAGHRNVPQHSFHVKCAPIWMRQTTRRTAVLLQVMRRTGAKHDSKMHDKYSWRQKCIKVCADVDAACQSWQVRGLLSLQFEWVTRGSLLQTQLGCAFFAQEPFIGFLKGRAT
jgi:hypothetical protein